MKTYDPIIRVSRMNGREESAESTMTIADQRAATRDSIRKRHGRVGRELKATDHSGFDVANNPALRTALERIRSGQSDGICISYGDRFARNMWEAGAFLSELAALDGDLILTGMEQIDYRTMEGRQMINGMVSAAETVYFMAKKRGDRIADDLVNRRLVPNRVPYGYRRNADENGVKTDDAQDAKWIVPDEIRAEDVRRIIRMRGRGESWGGIIAALEADGIPSPAGNTWTPQTLSGIVKNEAYVGTLVLGRRSRRGQPGTIRRVENAWDPLVTPAEWRAAQSTQTVTRNGRMVAGIAGAVLRCSGCAQPMRMFGSKHGRRYYGCRRSSGTGRCPAPTNVSADAADDYVNDLLERQFEHGVLRVVRNARDLDAARRAWVAAREHRKAWNRVQGTVEDEEWLAERAVRAAAEAAALGVYEDLQHRAADVDDIPGDADAWHALDVAHQRRIASAVLRVVVDPPASRSRYADITERFTPVWADGR
jgi:DNA invertase Pin-like site-specific DNA recombinase